jgi:small GTP-binding protein
MTATTTRSGVGALEEYAKLKLQLAGIVRVLLHLAELRQDETAIGDCRRLLARLAEDRFNLAIVGQFSRGKSSILNALLGAEKLPTGILPLTSVITTVAYGESERVLLQREGWKISQEIRLDQLPEYVTQRGNPGNEKRVTLAEVRLPHEMLRLGVHFIDTPGVASAIRANTLTTRQFLPEIDAAILVTSFESPLTEAEVDFLREIREHVRTVFVVVNKHDLVPADDREPVLQAIRENLKLAIDGTPFELFAVSARDALLAKQSGSKTGLDASGLPALEAALTTFLRTQKAREMLLRAADRTESIARRQAISIRILERARSPEEARAFEHRLQEIVANVDEERQAVIHKLLDRLRLELPGKCRERVPFWSSDSEAYVVSEWRNWFSRRGEIAGDAFPGFLQGLARKLFSEWLARGRKELERIFAEVEQKEYPAVQDLINRIGRIPAEVLAEVQPADGLVIQPIEAPPVAFRQIVVPLQRFELPWWSDLIPGGRLRDFAGRHWTKNVADFVRSYRSSAEAVLSAAVEDRAADIDRQIKARMESARSHLLKLLNGTGGSPRLSDIDEILKRIQRFRETVQGMQTGDAVAVQMTSGAANSQAGRSSSKRCSICSRLERTLWDFMARTQYELTVDESHQRQHALRLGFCPLHTWHYETVSSPQGVCAAYPEVLTRFADRLRSLAEEPESIQSINEQLRSLLPSPSSCPACRVLASDERALAEELARKICEDDAECPPLCAYHLHRVVAANPDTDAVRRLLLDEARAFDELAREMQNYALKHTAVRHDLTTRAESQAAFAGLLRLAGSQRLAGPWRLE